MEILFYVSLAWLAYAYVLFPALLVAVARLFVERHDTDWGYGLPRVTAVFALASSTGDPEARGHRIRQRVEDLRGNGYPLDRLQILAISDGPLPGRENLERDLRSPRPLAGGGHDVSVAELPEPAGKTAAQNAAVKLATGEILVFTDADTRLRRGALAALVRPLADPEVGCASGRLEYVGSSMEAIYWAYESWLKWAENRLGSLLGANGALYAVRTRDYASLPSFALADLAEPLYQLCQGRRTVWVPAAVALEELPEAPARGTFARKRRIALRALSTLPLIAPVLNLKARPAVALLFLSHKVLRWFTWAPLIGLYFSAFVLSADPFFARVALAQLAFYFYGAGIYAGLPMAALPAYVTEVAAAQLVATGQWLAGRREPAWRPTQPALLAAVSRSSLSPATPAA